MLRPEGDQMPVEIQEEVGCCALTIHVSGTLTEEDCAMFVPELNRLIAKYGKACLLVEAHDSHASWADSPWEDVTFDLENLGHVERVALVGARSWQKRMAGFCRPFTHAQVRYFEEHQLEEAQRWVGCAEGVTSAKSGGLA
jgi:hypothetical protein